MKVTRDGGSLKSWAGIERIGLFLIVAGFILANFYSLSPTFHTDTSPKKDDQTKNDFMSSQSNSKQQSIDSSASPLPLPLPSTLQPAILPVKVLPSPLWSIPSTASLGNVLVIGAGRPLGSALVAALYASGVAVGATEDGTMGFISSVHYDVPVFEFNISVTVGSLDDIWRRRAPDTVFVDGDAATPVAPWGAPLACVLSMPRFNLAQKTKRIVFLGDSAGSKPWGNDHSGLQENGLSGLCAEYVDSSKEQMDKLEYPSVGLVTWPGKIILGPSIDPTRPGAHAFGSPLNSFLLCLVRHAENVPISSHEFDLGKVLTFFASSLDSSSTTGCANLLSSAINEALNSAIDPSLASADAVAAALELSTASNEYLSSLHLFSSSLSSSSGEIVGVQESLGSQLLAATSWPLSAAHFINGLPRPSSNAALANPSVDSFKVQVSSAVMLASSSSSSSSSSAVVLPSVALVLSDTFWWVWRHALLRGYRYPEPLPDYDPEVRVGKKDKYSIHDIGTFGVSHETGHIKSKFAPN